MQLVRVAHVGPGLRADGRDRRCIERADPVRELGIGAAESHGARPPLLERRVVQERIGVGVQDLVRHHRRRRGLDRDGADLTALDLAEDRAQAVGVHRLVETVGERLVDERVLRRLDRTGVVVAAGGLCRKDRGQQILGPHALDVHRHALAAVVSEQRERARHVPAPARPEHRSLQRRLDEIVLERRDANHVKDVGEREAVLLAERKHDAVVGRRRLQLEVEGDAEALPEGEPPRAVDRAAERGVHDELHAAALVEEPLGDDRLAGGDDAEDDERVAHVGRELLRAVRVEAAFGAEPGDRFGGRGGRAIQNVFRDVRTQIRHRLRQLARPRRRLAGPERDRRRLLSRVLHAHGAVLDPPDAPGVIAEQEDVAPHALDREVFVDLADTGFGRLFDDVVVGGVGDGAPARDRGEARAAPALHGAMDEIAMEVRRAPAAARGDALGEHLEYVVEGLPLESAVRPGSAGEGVEVVLADVVGGGGDRDHLLRQDVERLLGEPETIELAGTDGADGRRRL